jgi:type IV pilus assembly protein PilY1
MNPKTARNRLVRPAAVVAAALLASGWARTLPAQSLPAFDVRPIVLILLDTSGSMEYDVSGVLPENADVDVLSVPTCGDVGTSGKSRFVVAQEVLTGSFIDYECDIEDRSDLGVWPCPREDCPYPVPHVAVPATVTQAVDGLVDLSRYDFKFGVMTFDTDEDADVGVTGGYSYGPEAGPNYGARNASAPTGWFVPPSSSDDPGDIAAVNEQVQLSIRSAIPYGGTPISPILHDALYYFNNDPEIAADPYAECRPKSVVLITDGRANLGEGTGPYTGSVEAAQALREAGINVYVIGYRLAAGVDTLFEDIATNNGTIATPLFRADNSVDLVLAFTQILGTFAVATQSRTRTIVTNDTGNYVDVQYQFNAAHALARTPDGLMYIPNTRQGLLEQSVYQCGLDVANPSVAKLARIRRLSDLLNARTDASRNVYTYIRGNLERFEVSNATVGELELDVPRPSEVYPDFSLDTTTGLCKTGFLDGTPPERRAQFRENLINFVRATDDTCRAGYKTGAIDHSTPALQGRLTETDVAIPSFTAYKESIRDRPIMLYTATHDGQLHAFRVDREDGTLVPDTWGRELWSYIPNHLLARLQELPSGTKTLMDGSPVIENVVLSRQYADVGGSETADDWRSVLVVGDRAGGRGYSALDVTNPLDGEWSVLWEVSELGRCSGTNASCNSGGSAAYVNDFSRLGWTYGKPAIGVVSICPGGVNTCSQVQLEEVAVAVFGAGRSDGLPAGTGRAVFVVRLDTGEKLAEFRSGLSNVDASCTGESNNITADMSGDVTCYSTFPGTFISRCFLGDMAGRLWRLEIGAPGIPSWNLTLFYDPYASLQPVPGVGNPIRSPVYEAPSLSIRAYRNQLVAVYGSGDMDDLADTTRKNFIASLTESVEPYPTVQVVDRSCSPWDDQACVRVYASQGKSVGPTVNVKQFFGYDDGLNALPGALLGERMMGPSVIFSNNAYFTTFVPDPSRPCEPGLGKIWGVGFDSNGGDCMTFDPALPSGANPEVLVEYLAIGDADSGSIPFGLAVTTRPVCYQGQSIAQAVGGGLHEGESFVAGTSSAPQIVVQTGVVAEAPVEVPAQGTTQRFIPQTVRSIATAIETLFVSSWGALFD